MKALTLMQPWASLLVLGEKRIETRSWGTRHRGPLAITASKSRLHLAACYAAHYREALARHGLTADTLPLGAVIGTVNVVECRPSEEFEGALSEQEAAFGDFTAGRLGWLCSDPKSLPKPIPCTGCMGVWTLPDDIRAMLEAP